MTPHPFVKTRNRHTSWEHLICLRCIPPVLRFVEGEIDGKWPLKSPRICDDVHKLCEYLWRKSYTIALIQ